MNLKDDAQLSAFENTELLCTDGIDNDGDTQTDCADVDCAEYCLPELFCDDGIDNDLDGLVDCQDEYCMYIAPCLKQNCTDLIDNDGNGLVDCADPNCFKYSACIDETVIEQTPVTCSNNVDDDNDGFLDCDDGDCAVFTTCLDTLIDEDTYVKCKDKLDNDKDGLVDCADPDCAQTEVCMPEAHCDDGKDNDFDSFIDCDDTDCLGNARCIEFEDDCTDGIDNEGDGFIDCQDRDCRVFVACISEATDLENSYVQCIDGVDNDNNGLTDCEDLNCAQTEACMPESNCIDGYDNDLDGFKDCSDSDCLQYSICDNTEDTYDKCRDGVDNDNDGLFDCKDEDCKNTVACLPEFLCRDGLDNDNDLLIDCDDPDCSTDDKCSNTEYNCRDGLDNDSDALIDCNDPDCDYSYDCNEIGPVDTVKSDSIFKAGSLISEDSGPYGMIIINNCTFDLWHHITAYKPVGVPILIDSGKAHYIPPETVFSYVNVPEMHGGRVWAYYRDPKEHYDTLSVLSNNFGGPVNHYNQFVEMTFTGDAVNYNISFVDYISLPVSVRGNDGRCPETRCSEPINDWLERLNSSCPTEMENEWIVSSGQNVGRCMGSYNYCINNPEEQYCTEMGREEWTGVEIYGGTMSNVVPATDTDFWAKNAAWNRGSEPWESNMFFHYREDKKPYNEYARMIHRDLQCRAYAFANDDHQGQGGFEHCEHTKNITITWCPDR